MHPTQPASARRSNLPIHSLTSARPDCGLRQNLPVRLLAKQLADHFSTIDNLERPADGGLDLLGRVNLERVAERSHQVGNGDGPVLDLGAVSVRCADHLATSDAAAS